MAIFHPDIQTTSPERVSLTGTRWNSITAPPERASQLHPVLGQLLAGRGVTSDAQAEAFLHATLNDLHDPMLMCDMAAAVAALEQAIKRGARIRIFGDYDSDGITATALLIRALGKLGASVDWYIPHRINDGYGLNKAALAQARADGVELGITVDNGITAHEQLAYAAEIGLQMIVTDHHLPGDSLPPAIAVLDPKRADNSYPDVDLAGVGVAFTLLRALCQQRGLPATAVMHFLDLVTLGTIADVAMLTGENRIIVRHGLPQLTLANKKIGLAALLRAVGVREQASCSDVGFQIAPRLNAAGRVAHADDALKLLLTGEAEEAEKLAVELCTHNSNRQSEELQTLEEAVQLVENSDFLNDKLLLLASPNWHPGVIGIVASRLVERYNRPTLMVALQDGVGKGSARARSPFHLWQALNTCSPLLRHFGGHQAAAGFEVAADKVAELRAALIRLADEQLTAEDLQPQMNIDCWLDIEDITTGFVRDVQSLAPFGMGNPTPVFAVADVLLKQCVRRGKEGNHISLSLASSPGGRTIPAIWFRQGDHFPRLQQGARLNVAFNVDLNTWQGVTSAQLIVKDVMI